MHFTRSAEHCCDQAKPFPFDSQPQRMRLAMDSTGMRGYSYMKACSLAWSQRGPHGTSSRVLLSTLANSGSGTSLMIVESPTKATKIQKFLGHQYKVLASYGHVRDLPNRNGSVNPDDDFAMTWELSPGGASKLKAITDAAHKANKVIFATDPDREGEAIAWHVAQELQKRHLLRGRQVERVTFTDITQAAVTKALTQPRQVSDTLVDAYMARRALDYLVGFTLSPVLWRRLPGAKSAGRVQSVALRVCCDREKEIAAFVAKEYWSLHVDIRAPDNTVFTARLAEVDGKTLKATDITTSEQAQQLVCRVQNTPLQVLQVTSHDASRSPPAPFTTSSLQQEAARRCGFSVSQTMMLAQKLYEGEAHHGEGLISYMRTDSTQLSSEAVTAMRSAVASLFGQQYVSPTPRTFKSKAKNSQEAHEAIRPTKPDLHPDHLPASFPPDQKKLYRLIWNRTAASQMADAVVQQVGADFGDAPRSLRLHAGASSIKFPGFLQVYGDLPGTITSGGSGSLTVHSAGVNVISGAGDDVDDVSSGHRNAGSPAEIAPAAATLLKLKVGQPVTAQKVVPLQHFTRPPGRYSEASLVKAMEELGIGRPSTYASTIALLQKRGYLLKEGRALKPTSIGMDLTTFLGYWFSTYVDYDFTSNMEQHLDQVAGGETQWKQVMRDFWTQFKPTCSSLTKISITDVYNVLDKELESLEFTTPESRICPKCGGMLQRKPSKFGSFIGCSNFDNEDVKCAYARTTTMSGGDESGAPDPSQAMQGSASSRVLGQHPVTGDTITAKSGPYGPYLQMTKDDEPGGSSSGSSSGSAVNQEDGNVGDVSGGGGVKKKRGRPKTIKKESTVIRKATIPKHLSLSNITLEDAVKLLLLPRELGQHPQDGAPILANVGRFGPYVQHGSVYASLPKELPPETISMDQALAVLAEKANNPGRTWGRKKAATAAATKTGTPKSSTSTRISTSLTDSNGTDNSKPRNSSSPAATSPPPVKTLSSYNVFTKEQLPVLKASHPDAKFGELLKMVAAEWKQLSPEQKQLYVARTTNTDSPGISSSSGKDSKPSAKKSRSTVAKAGPDSKKTAASPGPPSRPMSAYNMYTKQQLVALRSQQPQASGPDLMRMVAANWRQLTPEQKQAYTPV